MKLTHQFAITVLIASCAASFVSAQTTVVDFEDVGTLLLGDSAYRGEDSAGGFSSGPVDFINRYDPTFDSWNGAAYSNRTSWSAGGASGFDEFLFGNETVVADGTGSGVGAGGSDTWGVFFGFAPNEARFDIDAGYRLQSLQLNNTRTTAYILENGNSSADPFGPGDLFEVIFNSISVDIVNGMEQVTVLASSDPFVLANGTSFVSDWTTFDLEGTAVENASTIGLEFRSTDVGPFGINTPTFLAVDNLALVAVPEPTTFVFVLFGGLGAILRRSKR